MADIAVASDAWPDDVRKFSNNYANQYETPVLFYALIGIAIFIRANDILMVVLAWSSSSTRVVHAFIAYRRQRCAEPLPHFSRRRDHPDGHVGLIVMRLLPCPCHDPIRPFVRRREVLADIEARRRPGPTS